VQGWLGGSLQMERDESRWLPDRYLLEETLKNRTRSYVSLMFFMCCKFNNNRIMAACSLLISREEVNTKMLPLYNIYWPTVCGADEYKFTVCLSQENR